MKGNLPEANTLLDLAVDSYKKEGNAGGLALALVRRANTLRGLGLYSDSLKDTATCFVWWSSDSSLQPLYAEALRIKG
ncbi:MAG: hypothetical protein U0V48_18585 [Anaerolineales bacterium]